MIDPDELKNMYGALTDEERNARVADLIDTMRPYADELIARYTTYIVQFNGDEAKAFHSLIMFLSVGLEMAKYDDKAMMALVAFMARRLSNSMPDLARSLN